MSSKKFQRACSLLGRAFRSLAGMCLVGVGCVGLASTVWAQLPSVGGATAGANVGPSIGPNIGPQVPSAGGQLPGGSNLPATPRNAAPLNRNPRNMPVNPNRVLPDPVPSNGIPTGAVPNSDLGRNVNGSAQAAQNSAAGLQQNLGLEFSANGNGLRIGNINAGSVSSRAGLQIGDEILAVNRSWVRSRDQFFNQLAAATQSNGRAWVLVNRGGQQLWVNAAVDGANRPTLGVLANDQRGFVQIADVTQGSAAANAGLRAGDQVLAVNGKQIRTFNDLTAGVRAAAATNGQVDLTIMRDGVEQTVHAVLGQANNVAQQANAAVNQTTSVAQSGLTRAQQTAANLQQDVDSLADAGGEAIRSKVGEVQKETQALRQEVNAVVKETGEQLVQKLAVVREKVRSVESQLTSLANQASGDLKARLEKAQDQAVALEQELMDTTQGTAERVTNRVGNLAAATGQRAAQLQERAMLVRDSLTSLANSQTVNARNRLQYTIREANALEANVAQFAQNGSQAAISQARDEASALQARLRDLGADAIGEAQAQLKELEGHTASLRGALQAMASAEIADATRGATNIRTEIASTAANLESELKDIAGQADAKAGQQLARLQEQAASLREDITAIEGGATQTISQRLTSAREKAAQLRQEVANLVQEGSTLASERLDAIQDRAAILGDRLADMAGSTVNTAASAVQQTGANLNDAVGSVSQTNVTVDGQQRGRLGLTVTGPAGNLTVTEIENGSLAANAGLRTGDRVKAINGVVVADPRQLDGDVAARSSNNGRTTISFERDGQIRTVTLGAPITTIDTAKLDGMK